MVSRTLDSEGGESWPDNHNVFISHRHEDDALVGQLKELLAENGAEVRDSSVTSDNPNKATSEAYIKQILAERIQWAGKVIVIISPDTKNHDWVSWEIEYANRFPDKRIIGVWAPGAAGVDMPAELDEYADAVVGLEQRGDHRGAQRRRQLAGTRRREGPAAEHQAPELLIMAARLFSYVVRYDYGFAPNPFEGCCTIATCKPQIRRAALGRRLGSRHWVRRQGSRRSAGLRHAGRRDPDLRRLLEGHPICAEGSHRRWSREARVRRQHLQPQR